MEISNSNSTLMIIDGGGIFLMDREYSYTGPIKVYIPVYVDDQLMACNGHPHLDEVKAELSQHFKMNDMGPPKYIVGLGIHQDTQDFLPQSAQVHFGYAQVVQHGELQTCVHTFWSWLPS